MGTDRSPGSVIDQPDRTEHVRALRVPDIQPWSGGAIGSAAAAPSRAALSAAHIAALQRAAGNAAVGRYLGAGRALRSAAPQPLPVQRDDQQPAGPESAAGGNAPNQSLKNTPAASFAPAKELPDTDVERTVNAIIAAMGPTATTVVPYQRPAVASADGNSSGDPAVTAQATAMSPAAQRLVSPDTVQRSGGGGGAHGEGGITASGQICYNLCTGEVTLVGWIWAGAGVKVWGNWFGAFYFWEGSRVIGQLEHIDCGVCSPTCGGSKKGHDKESGWGLAGFPVALEPGDWGRFKKLGLEVGILLTPHSVCDADLEVIALVDLLEYVPSMKPPLEAAKTAASALGIDLKCGLGIDVSGTVHLCKNEQGKPTADSAKVCGGLFLACGVGLSDKGAGHGQHPVPA